MAAVRTHEITHHIRRANGTYHTYVETRPARVGKYRMKLTDDEASEACKKVIAGMATEDVAREYNVPLTTFTRIMYAQLLDFARSAT